MLRPLPNFLPQGETASHVNRRRGQEVIVATIDPDLTLRTRKTIGAQMWRGICCIDRMPTKEEAQPRVQAETAPVPEDNRETGKQNADEKAKDEESVAPPLPTSKNQGPRRSGAV